MPRPRIQINEMTAVEVETKMDELKKELFNLRFRNAMRQLDNPVQIIGNAVYGSPGWGYVHHDSNAILENNASFDTFGAGCAGSTANPVASLAQIPKFLSHPAANLP